MTKGGAGPKRPHHGDLVDAEDSITAGAKRATRSDTRRAQAGVAAQVPPVSTARIDSPPLLPHAATSAPSALLPGRDMDADATLVMLSGKLDRYLQAIAKDQLLKKIIADDQVAELANRRGLMVRFLVTPPPTAAQPAAQIEVAAPEFSDVAFLKRRIVKARLLQPGADADEFCQPELFKLELAGRPVPEEDPERPGVPAMLFGFSYSAGNTYDGMCMVPAPPVNDREQQARLLGNDGSEGPSHMLAEDPEARRYQELLRQGGGGIIAAAAAAAEAAETPARNRRGGGVVREVAGVPLAAATTPVGATAVAADAVPGGSPRVQRAGHWSAPEIEALVEGVQAYGQSWAKIKEAMCSARKIDEKRTAVDLKDKWRNLVKVSSNPNKQTRIVWLTDELKTTILRLAQDAQSMLQQRAPVPGVAGVTPTARTQSTPQAEQPDEEQEQE